eukprot:898619-Pyramimonas_sp.AAC.1
MRAWRWPPDQWHGSHPVMGLASIEIVNAGAPQVSRALAGQRGGRRSRHWTVSPPFSRGREGGPVGLIQEGDSP